MATLETLGLRERKRLRTRRTIARVALELFDRQGFQATTIPQIAEAADVSPRTVSAYFPHKEDLAFPDVEEELRGIESGLRSRRPGDTAADALREWIRSWLEAEGDRATERRVRRRVIRGEDALRAYEHRYTLRARQIIANAVARDLGASPDDLEPRMAAAATVTIFELLGEHEDAVSAAAPADELDIRAEALAALDRALLFIGAGIQALRKDAAPGT